MALSDYAKYKKLTIDSSKIDSDLSHFPLPIPLGSAVGLTAADVTDIFTEVGADYLKIAVFMADETTQLYCEVEQWDATNNKGLLWVSRDTWSVLAASDVDIYLAFDSTATDNTTYVGTPGNRTEVWNSDFAAFYTLAQDPTGGANCMLDSTANANHGTPEGAFVSGDLVDGLVGKAIDFGAASEEHTIQIASMINTLALTSGICSITWIKCRSFADGVQFFVSGYYEWDARYYIQFNNSTAKLEVRLVDGAMFTAYSGFGSEEDAWIQIAVSAWNNNYYVYFNGSQVDTGTYSGDFSGQDEFALGALARGDDPLNGQMTNAGFFTALPSDAWIKADYHAQTDNLLTFGATQTTGITISTAPIQTDHQIKATVTSQIAISAPPIQTDQQIKAIVRVLWPHKLNDLSSGQISTLYETAVSITDVEKINEV